MLHHILCEHGVQAARTGCFCVDVWICGRGCDLQSAGNALQMGYGVYRFVHGFQSAHASHGRPCREISPSGVADTLPAARCHEYRQQQAAPNGLLWLLELESFTDKPYLLTMLTKFTRYIEYLLSSCCTTAHHTGSTDRHISL